MSHSHGGLQCRTKENFTELKSCFQRPAFPLLSDTWAEKKWGHNVTEFQQRFDEILTRGEGPRRLKNLYFIYLIELRALSKVLPYFERPGFQLFTGNQVRDAETKALLLQVLRLTK